MGNAEGEERRSDHPPATGAVVITVATIETEARADVAVVDLKVRVLEEDKVCRICHLSRERTTGEGEGEGEGESLVIQIGCACKNELGSAHRDCAETWFRVKGNRFCEICGMNAENITGEADGNFMEKWHGSRAASGDGYRNSSERVACLRGQQTLCNFLMTCLVIAFILPWFFRVNMF